MNYVELNLQNLIKICYHYDVGFVPNSPKKLLPIALDEFMKKYFKGFFYGFDGQNNMITNRKLTIDNSEFDELTKNVEAVSGDRKRSFDVKIKLVSEDNMDVLKNYKNDEKPAKANQNLDIILKSVFRQPIANNLAVRAGRNIFFVPKERPEYLGDGMDLWYGLFQSAILGREKVYLNVDVMHKAFPSQVRLLDHIKVQDRNRPMRTPEYLDDENLKKLNSFLNMLTIGYRLDSNEPLKTYGFNGIGEPASKAKFEYNGKMMTVEEYFAKEKNKRLKFPNLPVLWVGSKTKKIFLPLEFCEIPPGQVTNKTCTKTVTRNMIKVSVTTPDIRKDKIRHSMEKLPYKTDPTIKAFGVQVDDKLQNVGARVIDPPILNYLDGPVKPFGGAWKEKTFLEVERNCIKWCIINGFKPDFISKINVLKNTLIQEAKNQKIKLEDFRAGDIITMKFAGNKNKVEEQLVKLKHLGYQFVLAVVSSDDDYQVVKNKAELCVGILTTCIDKDTIEKRLGGNNSTVKNILIKLNAKLNGKMHEIDESSFKSIISHGGTMFIGADVTHPSPDQRNIPSIVGVVSSYDQFGTKYFPSWRLQKHGELIQDLEEILVEHFKIYRDTNNKLPHKIMYYRDGVSDSEFEKVLNVEMAAIRKAMQRIYGLTKPAEVTFIVVQKRHRTRFFPTDPKFADRKGNILPGTIVDKDIVHPFQFQFFLASHTSLQGVTKPSKYCILVNESKISADDIQAITYDLCHLFSRCSRSVSYPAPTYYAHLLADRAKQYFDEDDMRFIMEDIDRANKKYQNNLVYQKFVRESPMFFI